MSQLFQSELQTMVGRVPSQNHERSVRSQHNGRNDMGAHWLPAWSVMPWRVDSQRERWGESGTEMLGGLFVSTHTPGLDAAAGNYCCIASYCRILASL